VLAGGDHFAVSELVLSSVIRIVTSPRVFDTPATVREALAFSRALMSHPMAVSVTPGARHWQIFEDLVTATGISGSDTTDAFLAALAMEHGCEWWSSDTGFARFPGLDWRNPLGGSRGF
jgi:toxin-antitoxin system PIN domain toxin